MVTTVGVPLITQVELSIDNPVESVGEAVQAEIACPLVVRVLGVTLMAVLSRPFIPVDKR